MEVFDELILIDSTHGMYDSRDYGSTYVTPISFYNDTINETEENMKNKDKPTADLDELKKIIGPESLTDILPEKPKYKLKGQGYQRTKFNVTQQGLQLEITQSFFDWLPENHKCYVSVNNTRYKHISPEATSIWLLLEKYKLDLTVDYKTLYDFTKL